MASVNLHRTLIKNYIVFVLTMFAVGVLALLFLVFSLSSQMSQELQPRITASDIAIPDFENMELSDVNLMGGWAEILDRENRVVFVKGDKKTSDRRYNNEKLYQMLSYEGSDQKYICTAKAFTAEDGLVYTCLVILPGDSVALQLNLAKSPLPVSKKFFTILFISLLFFILLFALNVFLYGKWSAKKISRPLESITKALNELRGGMLGTRMDFRAENEFLQIRDAFNEMAAKLETGQMEKMKLEEARNRMFIDISHDLKTPITVINAYSRALAENMVVDESQKQRYLETIYNKSVRVSNMIENLFEMAKLENDRTGQNREATDLSEFLRGIAAEYYEQIEEKGLLLDLQIPEESIPYVLDRREISRSVSNLLSNAIQYNPPGTVIQILLSRHRDKIVVEVADNGTGIPEGLRETLFHPFVRGDSSRGSEGGTGLGLAIARKIVEIHGGTLELQFDERNKTIFRITLPL